MRQGLREQRVCPHPEMHPTPAASLYAQILTEIKRQRACDETPRFAKHGRGYVGLSQWLGSGLAYDIARHNQEVKRRLLARLREMAPEAFEELIAELLVALGFEDVQLTSYSKDGGIDVRGTLVVGEAIRTRIAVQVKRWQNNVGATVVQQVRGSLGTHEQGLIITTSGFGKRARAEAARADAVPVGLMDGGQLVDLLIENEIGVVRKMKRRSYPVRGDRFRTRGLVGSSRVSSRGGDEVVKGDRVEGGRVGHELDDESEHADSSRGVQQPTATGTRCRAQTAS